MFTSLRQLMACVLGAFLFCGSMAATAGESWLQLKFDSRHSGNVPDRSVSVPLGLIGAVPLTDAIFTAPVIADGRVYVVDGSGVAFCIDAATLRVVWKVKTRGGPANCNNVSSPAIAGPYLHFGTMAGSYYVLDGRTGEVVTEIRCGEPIFSAPVVGEDRVYFATLGSRVYAIRPDGTVCWTWDFVQEEMGWFRGDRWNGQDWVKLKEGRVTWDDQFCCSTDIALHGKTLVIAAGSAVVWLRDAGDQADLSAIYHSRVTEPTRVSTLGLCMDRTGTVHRQIAGWDNTGEVEAIRVHGEKVEATTVPGTETGSNVRGLLSFSSVSVRGNDIYRCRPEEGFGLCRHVRSDRIHAVPSSKRPDEWGHYEPLGGYPSIASPILLRDSAVFGGLDGRLYIVPLDGKGTPWSFQTAFGKPISAPAAVSAGRIYFGCEDGYLYVLGPNGNAALPTKNLELWRIRSPLTSKFTDPKYDWYTNYGNWANTAAAPEQELSPPFRLKWVRRYAGTVTDFSTCGAGRLYTHTAEGQVFAVEQETGRLLWRRYFPGVYVSYTAPLYHSGCRAVAASLRDADRARLGETGLRRERLLVPQAGLNQGRLRCLEAATGKLLWEAPFSGSPGFNRNMPPVVYKNLVIYMFGTGRYTAEGEEGTVVWLHTQGVYRRPELLEGHRPLVRAWDIETGREVWTRDFSQFGSGGDDAGLCLSDGVLYYSCFFGQNPLRRRGRAMPRGVTAALDPLTGRILWCTTKYSVHSACTVSAEPGRVYLGGYAPAVRGGPCYVWCLDARDGSLIWQSEPLAAARNVVAVGPKFLMTATQSKGSIYLLDKATGKILKRLPKPYMCTRYTLAGRYILGPNADVLDPATGKFIASGPAVDPNGCVGAILSNGRIFYTSQAGGLQLSFAYGPEAAAGQTPRKNPNVEQASRLLRN